MIISTDEYSSLGVLAEYPTSTGEVAQAGFDEAISDNPFTKLTDFYAKETAGGEQLSKKTIEERALLQGVSIKNIPDEGMTSGAADILLERQYQKKKRAEAIAASGGGFLNKSAEIGGGLVGSLLDPVNIAASFIPVVGQAKYGAWLAKAAGPLGRMGVRAGVGAAEGLLGAAVIEPANYALSQELGDDYGSADSLLNLAFGTVLGGGLHAGMGAVSDAFKARRAHVDANGKIAKQVSAMSPEAQMDLNRTALAQALEDRPIDVSPVRQAQIMDVRQKLSSIEVEIGNLRAQGLEAEAAALSQKKMDLFEQLQEKPLPEVLQEKRARAIEKAQEQGYKFEMAQDGDDLIVVAKNAEGEVVGQAPFRPDAEGQLKNSPTRRVEVDAAHRRKGVASAMYAFAEAQTGKTLSPGASQTLQAKAFWAQTDRPFGNNPVDAISLADAPNASRADIETSFQKAATSPDARFVDEKIIEQHRQELESFPPDNRVEEAEALMKDAEQEAKEMAEQMGMEYKNEAADEAVKSATEYGKLTRAMALCMTRKS